MIARQRPFIRAEPEMACDILSTRGAVFVLWGAPTKEDVNQVVQAMRDGVQQVGAPILYVTRIPAEQPAPSGDVRRYVNELMPTFVELLSSYHVVLEGDGFAAAVKRAVLLGLFQLTWRRQMFFVHSNVKEVLSSLEPESRPPARELLALANSRGLLEAAGPTASLDWRVTNDWPVKPAGRF